MTGICFCLKPGGWGFSPRNTAPTTWACGRAHLEIAQRNYGKEHAMEEVAAKARAAAGALVGEYLGVIGKTDLNTFTPDEFDMLIRTAIEGYRDAMIAACEPF